MKYYRKKAVLYALFCLLLTLYGCGSKTEYSAATKEKIETNADEETVKVSQKGYSDEELITMAYNYIKENTSWDPQHCEIESEEKFLTIWFYDIISDGEGAHGVTRGRFKINRETGEGEDIITFEEINFTKYAEVNNI